MKDLEFLEPRLLKSLTEQHGSPLYIYSRQWLEHRAQMLTDICNESNINARYAIKANPHRESIKIFDQAGVHFDASSDYEAELLLTEGIDSKLRN